MNTLKMYRGFSIASPVKMSVFDLDYTLVWGNSSFSFCRYLWRKRKLPFSALLLSLWCYGKHRVTKSSLQELHKEVFERLIKGRSFKEWDEEIGEFVEKKLVFYPPALDSLRKAQAGGHYTVLLSSSPSFLVGAIAALLGVDAWRATEYGVDNHGNFCQILRIIDGDNKAQSVLELMHSLQIGKTDLTAYSDSYFDLPLLLMAGKAVAVNPDRRLRMISRQALWKII